MKQEFMRCYKNVSPHEHISAGAGSDGKLFAYS